MAPELRQSLQRIGSTLGETEREQVRKVTPGQCPHYNLSLKRPWTDTALPKLSACMKDTHQWATTKKMLIAAKQWFFIFTSRFLQQPL